MENTFEILDGRAVETVKKDSAVDETLMLLYGERFQKLEDLRRYEALQIQAAELLGILNARIKLCESELGEAAVLEIQKASPHIKE